MNITGIFSPQNTPAKLEDSMPKHISFLQGLGTDIDGLDVAGRWKYLDSSKSLAVPIGIAENGETFYFDIMDRTTGPNGIIAGTAGSGKTEALRTLLLSMAVHFSPEDVNFALLEFKTKNFSRTSNLLQNIPHLAGTTSIYDQKSVLRFFQAMIGEKNRRMYLLEREKNLTVKSVSAYQQYRRAFPDAGLEPLPHLIVVIDDFAEFIHDFPDLYDDITSLFRIGRSLGIYMILVMQSPMGIVRGQVWANTMFRICMRTASSAESKEILGTKDAFDLCVPGRAVIQTGANSYDHAEIEQVQIFSAVDYYSPVQPKPVQPKMNMLGKIRTLFGGKTPQTPKDTIRLPKKPQTESSLIIREILSTAETHHFKRALQICPDPLPETLSLDKLIYGHEAYNRFSRTWHQENSGLAVTAGIVDDPAQQSQYPLVLDFMRDGHQMLYGAPSSGKTTFLQTMLISAALAYTPEQVNFIILDYGSFVLKIFETLPHCIIVADQTDAEKLRTAADFLQHELTERRRLFSSEGVTNIAAYREAAGVPIPAIIVAVDDVNSLTQQNPEIMDVLVQTARIGGTLGIYLMITAGTYGGSLYRISVCVKSSHTLQMTDKADYRLIVGGHGSIYPDSYPGRGLTKGGLEFHTALCFSEDREADSFRKLQALCAEMSEAWTGIRPDIRTFRQKTAPAKRFMISTADSVHIGFRKGTNKPAEFVFREMNGCIISGADRSGKSSILGMIAQALDKDPHTKLYVFEKEPFIAGLCRNAVMMHTPEDADRMIAEMNNEYSLRNEDSEGRIVFCIDDFFRFYIGISQKSADILEAIARGGKAKGMYIYAACTPSGMNKLGGGNVPLFSELLKNGNAIAAGGRLNEYRAFIGLHRSRNMTFAEHDGVIIHSGSIIPVVFASPQEVKS